jgi:prevent-host-death family protein
MAKTFNLYAAKTRLSSLVDRAAAGEEIIIAKAGRPMARLVPFQSNPPRREPGDWKGQIWIAPDFDAPMSPEELALWEDGPIFPPDKP